MYIKVRTVDLKENVTLFVSKNTYIKELKASIEYVLKVKPEMQRLFYRGKQLEDNYTIFDYDINLNDVVQLMINPETEGAQEGESLDESTKRGNPKEFPSKYFRIGDFVDVIDNAYGAWFEGKVMFIKSEESKNLSTHTDDGLLYCVQFEGEDICQMNCLETINNIRPRSYQTYKFEDLKVGDRVLVNYNVENPVAQGYWYDFEVTYLSDVEGNKRVAGTLFIGRERIPLENVIVKYCDNIMKIEMLQKYDEYTANKNDVSRNNEINAEKEKEPACEHCNDNVRRKCKYCGCYVCGGKNDPAKLILCDECEVYYHLGCLNPPLDEVPTANEWYCPECKNDTSEIVHAGEKLKASKKKTRMASKRKQEGSGRDWGKGMACVGRTKECTIVPRHHYGPIPGVEVGSSWKFRLGASESGVHRPHIAGIHGCENDGAYSIVLSGGYEDDVDNGETFMYTGSGGRNLSGNKRTAAQSSDQTLTRMNKALALNCNTPLNEAGGKAKDWRAGKAIRVVRSYKLSRHSKYAPDEGCRYDGIYKVLEYYPETGKSGYKVWRYKLRRDDPAPAPWTLEGKKQMEDLGLTMIFPEGYLEAMKDEKKPSQQKAIKRLLEDSTPEVPAEKQIKFNTYKLNKELDRLIAADKVNEKLWASCREVLIDGKQKFMQSVKDNFMCICCMELVHNPVTTKCNHNLCVNCLQRSFEADVYSCPCCRYSLNPTEKLKVNEKLRKALVSLFPGYEAGR